MRRIVAYKILSVPAFGLMYIFTAIMILIGLPFIYLKMKKTVKVLMRFWAKSIFLIIGKKLQIEGRENIHNDIHFILVANHASLFDIIAIVSVIPDISWFGHERLLKVPFFRRVLILTDYIPMRKASYRNTKEMISLLKDQSGKNNVAIFPEGTRTLSGKINDFYRGFILLLRASDIDVLPVTLNGFYSLKPKNRFYIDFGIPLQMIIHPSIERESLISLSDREIADVVKCKIESATTDNPIISQAEDGDINTKLIKA
ncbi:MAG: lysophospholipid acyltransferase family protein [Bacteroidales bacterium]|jgi:1-acyl-sn-glycerol-3-phosphate acyltransferase